MNYAAHLCVYLCIYIITALSLNLVLGYCGYLTMSHAGYFAVGSYTYALSSLVLHWGFIPALLLSVLIAAATSAAVSVPAWRLRGDFFILFSLAVQMLIYTIANNWFSTESKIGTLRNMTNGPFGISGIPQPTIFAWQPTSIIQTALLYIGVAVLCSSVIWLLMSSPWGRLLKCCRDDELAARTLGKNARLVRVQAFAIACGLVAIAGGLYAAYVNYIDPSTASVDQSILIISMVVIGGTGSFRGPVLGAAVVLLIPELLRFLHLSTASASNLRLMLFGVIIVVLMHLRPRGLAGEYSLE